MDSEPIPRPIRKKYNNSIREAIFITSMSLP